MTTNPNAGIRLGTMALDHLIMTIIAMIFYPPVFISSFSTAFTASHDQPEPNPMSGPLAYFGWFGLALYFCKDMIKGRSLAKLLCRLQIVDNKTGEVASPLQCALRNVFCILWPIEFIVALANPSRRIGDYVAGTRLVYYDPTAHQSSAKVGQIFLSVILTFGLVILVLRALPTPDFNSTSYSKTSYNPTASKELEQILTSNLSNYLTPSIRIYDSSENTDRKYISAIIKLKENYLENDNNYRQIHEMTTRLIYDAYPKESFEGHIRYVFRGPGRFSSKSTNIGKTAGF